MTTISPNELTRPPANYTGVCNLARLNRALAAKGITRPAQLADHMAMFMPDTPRSEQTWRRIMDGHDPTRSGGSHGSRALILVLADALGVSVDWLLSSDVEAGS
jgi:hypothetical protein